jgi:acyl-CoA thioester hydrolase
MDTVSTPGMGAISFEAAFLAERTARPEEIDQLGHVNNAVYLHWVQDIALEHWYLLAPQEMQDNVIFVVLRHEIDYREAILEGEEVELRTWLGEIKGPRLPRYVDIRKKGAKRFAARSLTTWCMLDIKTRRPKRVGDDIFEAFGLPRLLEPGFDGIKTGL